MDKKIIDKACQSHSLFHPIHGLNFQELFRKEIGYLRDKTEYHYNRKGEMDFKEEDLLVGVSKVRFAIGSVIYYQDCGLAKFDWDSCNEVGSYFPSENDWMFCYFLDDSCSHLYSAWNRIANFLNIFWSLPNKKDPYFHNVVGYLESNLKKPFPNALKKIIAFKNMEYPNSINRHRREIIHSECTFGAYFRGFVHQHTEKSALKKIQEERDLKPKELSACYKRLLEGIAEMLEVIRHYVPPKKDTASTIREEG
ncbi:Cthe_2314 family HEPN domain-containing protein [Elusimicrobiota bacterium]